MNNRGKITVFLCLTVSVILMLFITVLKIINIYSAKEKATMCARVAMSNVRAGYNRYVFDNYHILLFDLNCGGKGEGAIEEQIKEDLMTNLGDEFSVQKVAITDYTKITDNQCKAFVEQIDEYIIYAVADNAVEKILDSTGDEDGELPDDLKQQLENDESAKMSDMMIDYQEKNDGLDMNLTQGKADKNFDPRDYTTKVGNFGILYYVMPEGSVVSDEVQNMAETPSYAFNNNFGKLFDVNYKFDSYKDYKNDISSHGSWKDKLKNAGYGVIYAGKVFNCATNIVNDNTAFRYEMEYLICGRATDYDNMREIVNKLTAMRLPVNYTYLMKSSEKMSQIHAVAMPLSLVTFVPEPILKHLIAGCWAYVESICEVRCLLEGKRLAFKKNRDNWITDLYNLDNSRYEECNESENGLDYMDYLTILLALEEKNLYLRMLDLIQLNANKNGENIRIEDCAVELSVDMLIETEGRGIGMNLTTGY